MKKNLIILFLAMVAVLDLSAVPMAPVPVATLNHDGQLTQFTGSSALKNAHDAAVSGDVITLNSGAFNACTITKGITLRGACMRTTPEMEELGMKYTYISGGGNMIINVPQSETNALIIEDVCIGNCLYLQSVPSISLTRVCGSLYIYDGIGKFDAVQCVLYEVMPQTISDVIVFVFVNSTVAFKKFTTATIPFHIYADHCVIGNISSAGYDGVFNNCIFTSSTSSLFEGIAANYCVAVNSDIYQNCVAIECKTATMAELFDDQVNDSYSYGQYINPLTEVASATYLGSDGSQVGIYGGAFPFTMMPNNPIVTTNDIAEETTEDGKLRVLIEVKCN